MQLSFKFAFLILQWLDVGIIILPCPIHTKLTIFYIMAQDDYVVSYNHISVVIMIIKGCNL